MAIVKVNSGGGEMANSPGAKAPAKGAKHAMAKHAAKKHAVKKHAAKKHAAKHATKAAKHAAKHAGKAEKLAGPPIHVPDGARDRIEGDEAELGMAFHHLRRASSVISLLEAETGGDLRALLEHGIEVYRSATATKPAKGSVRCAAGLLRAAEHLGMAGLYSARKEHRVEVGGVPYRSDVEHHLDTLGGRLDGLSERKRNHASRLEEMARELLRQAGLAGDDPHLEYELTMAADGICTALEAGL
jgi:hypothetical protein